MRRRRARRGDGWRAWAWLGIETAGLLSVALVGVIGALGWVAWAFAGAGHAIGMHARISGDPVFASTNRYGAHFFSIGAGMRDFA